MSLIQWCCLYPSQQRQQLLVSWLSFLFLSVSLVLILGIGDKEGHLYGHTRNLEGIKISCLLFNFLEQHFLAPGLPERRVLKVFLWRWKMDKWWPFWPSQITPSQASFVLVVSHTLRDRKTGKVASFESEERISAFLSIFLLLYSWPAFYRGRGGPVLMSCSS